MNCNISQKNIPKGWAIKKIKDVLSFEQPGDYIVESTAYTSKGKTPVLTANKSFVLGYTNEDFGIYNSVPVIIFDDFTTDSKYVDFPFKIKSSAIKILKTRDSSSDLKFIYEILKATPFPVESHKRHYISQYQEQDIVIPLLHEQSKIGEILSSLDKEIQKIESIVLETGTLRSALMQVLFTEGIGHKSFKKTEVGKLPETWSVKKLSQIATVERGKFSHRPRNAPEFYGGDIPFIQTGDVVNSNGRINSYHQTLNEKGLAVSKLFKKGTIVITIAANIGDTGILEFDSCFPDSLIGITCSSEIDSVFLEFYLRTQKNYLNSISTQSAQKNINLEKLNPLFIVLPPMVEQKRIANILYSLDEKIEVGKQLKTEFVQLKKGLMSDLLSGKVRVK